MSPVLDVETSNKIILAPQSSLKEFWPSVKDHLVMIGEISLDIRLLPNGVDTSKLPEIFV
jgi:hypothetical protein